MMRFSLKMSHALVLFAIASLAMQLTFIYVMFEVLGRLDYAQRARMNSVNASAHLAGFMVTLVRSGGILTCMSLATVKEYGSSVTYEEGDSRFAVKGAATNRAAVANDDSFKSEKAKIELSFGELVKYLGEDPQYWEIADALEKKNTESKLCFEKADRLQQIGNLSESDKEYVKGQSIVKSMFSISKDVLDTQAFNSTKLKREEERLKSVLKQVLLAAMLVSLVVAGAMALLLNRMFVANLKSLSRNVEKLAAQEKATERLIATDEFAALNSAFKKMFAEVARGKNAEKLIVESAVDLICSLDEHGSITQMNAASKQLLDYEPSELIGMAITEIVAEEQKDAAVNAMAEALETAKTINLQLRLLGRDGREVDTSWSAIWSDSELSFFCVAHDLSQRMRAERLKQEITAMISHDLRTPLTSLQVAVELFSKGAYGEFPDDLTSRLKTSTAMSIEAMDLINDLLDIEKLEQSTIELSFEPLKIDELIHSAWRDIAPLACAKGVSLNIDNSAPDILVDREQFVRVLRNLLRNSVVCSQPDSIVEFAARLVKDEITVSIEDTGPLLPAEEREFIFDRFRSVEMIDSPRVEGMGLALSVCKSLVVAQGGEIKADVSSANRFMYTITLPI